MKRRSWKTLAIVFGAVMMLLVPAGALAVSDTFTDVPSDHWAYEDVEWLAGVGLTAGCGDGKYCPDKYVKRSEFAAFTHRTNDFLIPITFAAEMPSGTALSSSAAALAEASFTNAKPALVTMSASLTVSHDGSGTGHADAYVWLQVDDSSCVSPGTSGAGVATVVLDEPVFATPSVNAAATVDGGSHTVTLCAQQFGDGVNVSRGVVTGIVSPHPDSSLTALP